MGGYILTAILAVLLWEAIRALRTTPAPAVAAAPSAPASLPDEVSLLDVERAAGLGHTPIWQAPIQANGVSAGCDAFLYARRGRIPDTRHMTPAQRRWLTGLSEDEIAVAAGCLPAKLDLHIAGKRMARGLPAVRPIRPAPVVVEGTSAGRAARR